MRPGSDWRQRYSAKLVSAAEAVAGIRRGQRVFIGSGAAEPQALVAALAQRGEELADNQIIHIRSLGVTPYTEPHFSDRFRYNTFFIGENMRQAVAEGLADYTPIFLSEVPRLFRQGKAPLDVALIQVTPPDPFGFCSYGVSVDIVKAAAESAALVVAEVNPLMPRTLGDSFIHADRLHLMVENQTPILELSFDPPDEVALRIGRHIAALVEDGATLQMGIGTIPDSVLLELTGHRDLGIHTEMLSDGIVQLIERGVVTSRGDVHYVVTEYGAVDLHGKSIRDRALALIHIAHPDFREELMRVARERHFVYADQVVVPDAGLPELEELESDFLSHGGVGVHFRPIEPTDEPLLQELFYRSSEKTIYLRFFSHLKALPHRRAQQFVAVDYQHHLALVGTVMEGERQVIIAVGRYHLDPATNRADCAFMVRDDWQDKGVGRYLVGRLIEIARNRGIEGMTADVLVENTRMMHVFHLCAPGPIQSRFEEGAYHISFALEPGRPQGS